MGSRVMEARNPGGKTVRRHLVPKRVRRSRKRAVRAAARPRKIARPRKAIKKTSALVKVAVPVKVAAPVRSAVSTGLAKIRGPVKSTELAKVTDPAKTTGTAKSTGIAKAKRGMRKAPKTPTPELAAAPEKPQPQPLDYLQDGAVEWGIKRD